MHKTITAETGRLTVMEQFVALAWLPASQLTGYSNRANYLALALLMAAAFYRAILFPLGSPARFANRLRPVTRRGHWLVLAWIVFGVSQIVFQMRGFGYYWGLKEVAFSLAWLFVIPIYFYTSFSTLNPAQSVRLLRQTAIGLLIIVVMNLAAHFANFQTQSSIGGFVGGESRMMGLFGIAFKRIIFPFGDGVNGYGVILALALVTSYSIFRLPGILAKMFAIPMAAACVFSLAAADSRAALAAALLVILTWMLLPSLLSSRLTGTGVLFSMLGPPLLIFLPEIVPSWLVELVSRSNKPGNLAEMLTTGRAVFWQGVFSDLINHPADLVYGYGPYSQALSDAGTEVGRALGRTGAVSQFTFHSTAAQIIMDSGLAGITAFYALALAAVTALSSVMRRETLMGNSATLSACRMVMSLFLVLLLTGVTESIATFYLRDSMIIFIVLASIASSAYLLWPSESSQLLKQPKAIERVIPLTFPARSRPSPDIVQEC